MIIDCHGHHTTAPRELQGFRDRQLAALAGARSGPPPAPPAVSDDRIREGIASGPLRVQRERGIDLTLFSPTASAMGHHLGDEEGNRRWAEACNDMVHRACTLFPGAFAGVCQLPQAPGRPPEGCIDELLRCVVELGFVGCNLNPDPSGGRWSDPPLGDRWWHPLYEVLVELDVPAMIHASASCSPALPTTGGHYLNADTTAFAQLLLRDPFREFPTLKLILPHGGGAVPYQWGRFAGLARAAGRPPPEELLGDNLFFDTCVHQQGAMDLLLSVVPAANVLFGSEALGAVPGVDPASGRALDDTRRLVEAAAGLSEAARRAVFEGNARRVYGRLARAG